MSSHNHMQFLQSGGSKCWLKVSIETIPLPQMMMVSTSFTMEHIQHCVVPSVYIIYGGEGGGGGLLSPYSVY